MKRVNTWALVSSILGTLWVTAVIVAYIIAGAAIASTWFWAFGTVPTFAVLIAPFVIYGNVSNTTHR